jgi:chromosome segregation ATPase
MTYIENKKINSFPITRTREKLKIQITESEQKINIFKEEIAVLNTSYLHAKLHSEPLQEEIIKRKAIICDLDSQISERMRHLNFSIPHLSNILRQIIESQTKLDSIKSDIGNCELLLNEKRETLHYMRLESTAIDVRRQQHNQEIAESKKLLEEMIKQSKQLLQREKETKENLLEFVSLLGHDTFHLLKEAKMSRYKSVCCGEATTELGLLSATIKKHIPSLNDKIQGDIKQSDDQILNCVSEMDDTMEKLRSNEFFRPFFCSTCLDYFNSAHVVSCGHFFCSECVVNFRSCPLCRVSLRGGSTIIKFN